jgi:hypothetical protein
VDILIALVMHTGAAVGAQISAAATEKFHGPKVRLPFVPLPVLGAAVLLFQLSALSPGDDQALNEKNGPERILVLADGSPAIIFGLLALWVTAAALSARHLLLRARVRAVAVRLIRLTLTRRVFAPSFFSHFSPPVLRSMQ